jgi:hypothetical protein
MYSVSKEYLLLFIVFCYVEAVQLNDFWQFFQTVNAPSVFGLS